MNRYRQRVNSSQTMTRRSCWSGFSMIELLIALAIFGIIGGAAVSLFRQHTKLFINQQNQAGLNYTIRNAVTQMQIDLSNAGDGFYQAADTAGWPLGITIFNQTYTGTSPHCWDSTTFVYSASCFDTLNIIVTDRITPPAHPSTSTGTPVLTSATSVYLTPVLPTTAAQLVLLYKANDQILFVDSTGTKMTTARLTADATTATITGITYVVLQHGPTKTSPSPLGTNDPCLIPSTCNDPYSISTNADAAGLQEQFDIADWVLKLAPITYSVDTTTDPNSPKLVRKQVATSSQAATNDVIAEQIIGFKVGVSLYNPATLSDNPYVYSVSSLTDFTKVRAVRISLISRTLPNPSNPFRNTFDLGPYKIEAASVVVNPRSLSMKDQ
jgi:prepilin-type N-terminal cleavage/methylation domain-containing protein